MPDRKHIRWMRVRLLIVAGLLTVGAGMLAVRMWTLQITQGDWLKDLARDQYLKEIALEPMRGPIVDRNGAPMAISIPVDSVFAMPAELVDPEATAIALAAALGLERAPLAAKLSTRKHFTWIKRRMTPAEAAKVRELGLTGVHFTRESRRFYPARELAGQLIGFAGDGRGLEGLELLFDDRLRGSMVLAQGLRDARGTVLFSDGLSPQDSADGVGLMLTIDLTIQEIAEAELERGVREAGARAGMAIAMDPQTGEILALANVPGFNPNIYWKAKPDQYRNRAVTDCFEPGSTMKIFTMAAALQQGAVGLDERVDCQAGRMVIGRHTIHDSSHHDMHLVSLRDVLVHSSNVGTAAVGLRLGRERLYRALWDFGFGRRTGVDLPGESACQLRPYQKWSEVGVATISFGQGVSANSLQLLAAVSAVANGGVWYRPQIIREVRGPREHLLQQFESEPAGRVLEERWTRVVTEMLVGVTEPGGTGTRAAVPGFRVAGKTGTAQKVDPIAGGYSKEKRVASFVGYLPAEQPRLALLVVIDEPTTSPYGGVVAAPVFAHIAEAALAYLGVFPEAAAVAEVPPPAAPPAAVASEAALVGVEDELRDSNWSQAVIDGDQRMPDLRGLSLREALGRLAGRGFEIGATGSGRVVGQQPVPGSALKPPARVDLVLGGWDSGGAELAALPLRKTVRRRSAGEGGAGSGQPRTPEDGLWTN